MPSNYELSLIFTNPLRACATFPSAFPGFDGHFPGNQTLPGFMHIQLALDTLALANLPAKLVSVQNAKFLRSIPPETPVEIALTHEDPTTYDIRISDPLGKPYSRFIIHTR
jgi:3-hydroxymyristoyl/3-hydroxydecanoyl-(acyl carrier protein) dehydratase